MSKHTPEPWYFDYDCTGSKVSDHLNGGWFTAKCLGPDRIENARRIVACVNACAGLGTEDLERNGVISASSDYFSKLKWQRDELLATLQGMIDIANDSQGVAGYHMNGEIADWGEFEEWQAACDSIAKIKGGAA